MIPDGGSNGFTDLTRLQGESRRLDLRQVLTTLQPAHSSAARRRGRVVGITPGQLAEVLALQRPGAHLGRQPAQAISLGRCGRIGHADEYVLHLDTRVGLLALVRLAQVRVADLGAREDDVFAKLPDELLIAAELDERICVHAVQRIRAQELADQQGVADPVPGQHVHGKNGSRYDALRGGGHERRGLLDGEGVSVHTGHNFLVPLQALARGVAGASGRDERQSQESQPSAFHIVFIPFPPTHVALRVFVPMLR